MSGGRLKPPVVPPFLVQGQRFYKFHDADAKDQGSFVELRTDPKGWVVYWTGVGEAGWAGARTALELPYVCDVRVGKYAKWARDSERARETLEGTFVASPATLDDVCLTLVTGRDYVDLAFHTFVAPSQTVAEHWAAALLEIVTNLWRGNCCVLDALEWTKARLSHGLPPKPKLKEASRLLASQRDERKAVEKAMQTAQFPVSEECLKLETLDEAAFFNFYRLLTNRKEVLEVFHSIGGPDAKDKASKGSKSSEPVIGLKAFMVFLNDSQRDPRLNEILYPYYTEKSAGRLVNLYEPSAALAKKGQLSLSGFLRFLMSSDNAILSPESYGLKADEMNEPLSSYLINSSHNTYLIGPQVHSRSSVEMYRQVLLAGCRSIELDCWDSRTQETKDEPVITHGPKYLFQVSEVLFKDVISAIAESGFKTTDYPLVLSLENHCSIRNQRKMATYLKDILGDLLLTEPLPTHPLEQGVPLPSPSALLRKVLIKNKKNSETPTASRDASVRYRVRSSEHKVSVDGDGPSTGDEPSGHSAEEAGSRRPSGTMLSTTSTLSTTTALITSSGAPDYVSTVVLNGSLGPAEEEEAAAAVVEEDEASDDDVDKEELAQLQIQLRSGSGDEPSELPTPDGKKQPIDSELSSLVNYTRAMGRFKSFEESEKRDMASELHSLSENKGAQLLQRASAQLVQHNRRQISRVFPRLQRVDSTNYVPQAFWNAGCQMVALNFQSLDLPMQLNQALFERNGRSGYLLKPESLRRKDRHFFPFEPDMVENIVANTLSIEIISGQLLSVLSEKGSRVSTYVEVEMYGLPKDTVRGRKHCTRIVRNNGINPHYQESPAKAFEFPKIIFPELASLRILVNDESQRMLAQRILPVQGIRPGYRHIVLRNAANQPAGLASLFVKISVRDYVPDAHRGFVDALQDPILANKRQDSLADALVNPIAHDAEQQKNAELLRELLADDEAPPLPRRPAPSLSASTPQGDESATSLVVGNGSGTPPPRVTSPANLVRLDSGREASGSLSAAAAAVKKNSVAELRKASAAAAVPAIAAFEAHDPRLPDLPHLDATPKMVKLRKTQEEERRSLAGKQSRERERLAEKTKRRANGDASPRPRLPGLFSRAVKKLPASPSQGQVSTSSMLSADFAGEDWEVRELASRQWDALRAMEEAQLGKRRSKLAGLAEAAAKGAQRELEKAFARDEAALMAHFHQRMKEEIAAQPAAKAEVTKRFMEQMLEGRRALNGAREAKEEALGRAEAELREALAKDHADAQAHAQARYEEAQRTGAPPDSPTVSTRL